jgi:hypothetical protein
MTQGNPCVNFSVCKTYAGVSRRGPMPLYCPSCRKARARERNALAARAYRQRHVQHADAIPVRTTDDSAAWLAQMQADATARQAELKEHFRDILRRP